MEPAVDDHLCGSLGVVVVAAHHTGAFDQHLAVLGDLDLRTGQARADRPEAGLLRHIEATDGTGLGHAVALHQQQAGRVEPGLHLGAHLGRAGNEELNIAAHAGFQLAEHQLVGQRIGCAHPSRHGLPLQPVLAGFPSDGERPAGDATPNSAPRRGEHHRCTDLLEDSRRTTHELRTHLPQAGHDLVHPPVDGRAEPDCQLGCDQGFAEHMRQRQPQVLHVAGIDDVHVAQRDALVHPTAMQQFDALGAPGGARGVDQGRQLVGGGGCDRHIDHVRLGGQLRLTQGYQLRPRKHAITVALAIHQDHGAHTGGHLWGGVQLGLLLGILRDQDHRSRVRHDVLEVFANSVGVDRGGRPAGAVDRQVHQHPFDPGTGDDGDPLLGAQPQGEQTGSDHVDALSGLCPVHRHPVLTGIAVAVGLAGWRRRHPPPQHCPDIGEIARLVHHDLTFTHVRCTPWLDLPWPRSDSRGTGSLEPRATAAH